MELYPVFTDVDMDEVHRDLNKVIYMLHYVDEEVFSKKEIRGLFFNSGSDKHVGSEIKELLVGRTLPHQRHMPNILM